MMVKMDNCKFDPPRMSRDEFATLLRLATNHGPVFVYGAIPLRDFIMDELRRHGFNSLQTAYDALVAQEE